MLGVSLLAACATARPPKAERPERRPLGADLPSYTASEAGAVSSEPPASLEEPQGVVRLEDALGAALLRSPDLAAFSWEVRSREGRALQAGLLPNPELGGEIEDFGGTGEASGFDASESTLLLSQRIETAGKRSKRRAAAALDADVAAWEYEAARLDVLAEARRAFFDVLAAQERLALSEELLRVAESSAEAVQRLVSAGATPAAERTRAAVEVATARVDVASAEHALRAARATLAATWGSLAPAFSRVEGDLQHIAAIPDRDTVQSWLTRNPQLERWSREIARREVVVELEDARRIPDVTAGAGLRRLEEGDDTALVVDLSVPLPVFDRNQGARSAARSELRKAEHQRRAVHAHLAAALETAYQELAARAEEVASLGREILPGAADAFEQIQRGYAQGLFRSVDVLAAQRRLFELRLREIDALRAYHAARADLERLTGTPLATDFRGARP